MSPKTVSVIVPAYNAEDYIERCLLSIVNQTYPYIEILVIDDGSTDSTFSIVSRLQNSEPRLRCFRYENGGLSAARNRGLRLAAGSYILFVDSDDYIDSRLIAAAVQKMEEDRTQLAVYDFQVADENGGLLKNRYIEPRLEGLGSLITGRQWLEAVLKNRAGWFSWSFVAAAELYSGIEFPEGRYFEDMGTSYKLFAEADHISVIHEKLYWYTQREASITGTPSADKIKDELQALEDMGLFVRQRFPDLEKLLRTYETCIYCSCYITLLKLSALNADCVRQKFTLSLKVSGGGGKMYSAIFGPRTSLKYI